MAKNKLGQFFITNWEYIFTNLKIPKGITTIIELFTGNGDLLNFCGEKYKLECYDIDPKHSFIVKRDTLDNPPDYNGKFIITNPPFLARNKSTDKRIFEKYKTNDLYKCFIKELCSDNKPIGGIIIVPLNFWSSIRDADVKLRGKFLEFYRIYHINIFEETVFKDTSYTVCSFQFSQNKKETYPIMITVYPSLTEITATLTKDNNYSIGGEIYNIGTNSKYTITRLTSKNLDSKNTNMVVNCIDGGTDSTQISFKYVSEGDIYIDTTPRQSARSFATLIIEPSISDKEQRKLVAKCNRYLQEKRNEYHSLFLTNYRESKTLARKRISFDLVYKITRHVLETM
jgi:hypothetical protein